ncbi:MAG: hypothetical protein AB7N76_35750 [Planctomycetota bacterium]
MTPPEGDDAPIQQRKAFLRILSSLAWADGLVDERELAEIQVAASDLSVALSERDMEARDLDELAVLLQDPGLRKRLIDELVRVAVADQELTDDELGTIKYFATTWNLPLPALEDVDWDEIELPWEEDA